MLEHFDEIILLYFVFCGFLVELITYRQEKLLLILENILDDTPITFLPQIQFLNPDISECPIILSGT
jgi:hypothetical protein